MVSTVEKAYAKINYQLHVGACRTDGFHEISTLMQTISLSDDVRVSLTEGDGICLTVEGNDRVPTDSGNLVWRAAEKYMKKIGDVKHVDIHLVKKIPMAGGLAGGSADAAAALRALNHLYNNALARDEMLSLAAELGSDVGFCVVGGLAHCTGRGEIVTPLSPVAGVRHFLIYNGGEAVSTPAAYRALDQADREIFIPAAPEDVVNALKTDLRMLSNAMYNDFEPVILPECPLASKAKDAFMASGAVASMMSGSGSTVFAVFDSEESAYQAQNSLPFQSIYATDIF